VWEAVPLESEAPADTRPGPVLPPDWKARLRKRGVKGRARGLAKVNLALALHYPTPFTFLAALVSGSLALALSGVCRNPRLAELFAGPAHFFVTLSSVFFLLTGLMQIGPLILGMLAPAATGRTLLTIALAVDVTACFAAGLALGLPWFRPAFLALSMVATMAAWVLWMAFLNRLGHFLERRPVWEAAAQTCTRVIRAVAVTGGFWVVSGVGIFFAIVIGVLYLSRFPPTLWFLPAGVVGAAAKVAWHMGGFDALWEFILFPTGLPVTIEYVNFIGGVRKILDRDS
jgi:hypothetical protein